MFQAIINTPGYLSQQDELPEFETCMQAWEYLLGQRINDLGDPMNDVIDPDDDRCLDELAGRVFDAQPGTVYGTTPGHEGDYDLGLAYSVIEVTYASKVRPVNSLREIIAEACCPPIGIKG